METAQISSGPDSSVNFTANGMNICRNATRQVIFLTVDLYIFAIANPLGSFLPVGKNDHANFL